MRFLFLLILFVSSAISGTIPNCNPDEIQKVNYLSPDPELVVSNSSEMVPESTNYSEVVRALSEKVSEISAREKVRFLHYQFDLVGDRYGVLIVSCKEKFSGKEASEK